MRKTDLEPRLSQRYVAKTLHLASTQREILIGGGVKPLPSDSWPTGSSPARTQPRRPALIGDPGGLVLEELAAGIRGASCPNSYPINSGLNLLRTTRSLSQLDGNERLVGGASSIRSYVLVQRIPEVPPAAIRCASTSPPPRSAAHDHRRRQAAARSQTARAGCRSLSRPSSPPL